MNNFEKVKQIDKLLVNDKVINKTNLIFSDFFSKQSKNNVYLKPENLQRSGSYKIRGSYYKIHSLLAKQKIDLIVTASAGNHAQGLSYTAQKFGVQAVVFMPTITPVLKINSTKKLGATVIVKGANFDESLEEAQKYCAENNGVFIHPFDDLDVATGQGTVAFEVLEQLSNVDIVLIPVGGGGLIAGMSEYIKAFNPNIKVIGVEPAHANCVQVALQNGKPTDLENVITIAEGVAVKRAGKNILPVIQNNIDDIITVEDSELIDVFLDLLENHKLVAEAAGLISLAALKHLNVENKNIVCIISGGNMDVLTMSKLIQRGLILRERNVTFQIELKDIPGELVKIAKIIASELANIIKIDYNPYASVNQFNLVYLTVTVECSGPEHKKQLLEAFKRENYNTTIMNDLKERT